jgi:hypothetical protein
MAGEDRRMIALQLTGFAKVGGPLTKRIIPAADGTLHSDGSVCVTSARYARPLIFDTDNRRAFTASAAPGPDEAA